MSEACNGHGQLTVALTIGNRWSALETHHNVTSALFANLNRLGPFTLKLNQHYRTWEAGYRRRSNYASL